MKMMIPLVDTPNHKFDGVARSIAQGAPPKWLVLGLTQFSQGIGVDTSDADNTGTVIEEMQDAAHVLMRRLPIYKHLGFGLPCPEEVTVVLQALPRIKEDLDRLAELNSRIGRRPDAQALMCAAVVARAWKIIQHPSLAALNFWRLVATIGGPVAARASGICLRTGAGQSSGCWKPIISGSNEFYWNWPYRTRIK